MKHISALGVAVLLLTLWVVPSPGQPTEAERKQFDAIKARADQGDAEAQLSLSGCYANGSGVAKDPAKSVKWLRKAAEQGLSRAQCQLGLNYENGFGVKPDKTEAVRWLRRAAEQGLPEGQFDLGVCYAGGDGVPRNAVEAAALYRKAAEQGLPDAQSELGTCYLEGNGVPKGIPEGVKWTRLAAEQGFGPAQNALGLCYLKGTGVPKDYLQAYKWFNLAAAKGDEHADDARVNLAAAERYLKPPQIAEAQQIASQFKPRKGMPSEESAALSPGASQTGVVNVKAGDESYEIFVDGGFVGNTPAKVKLSEGVHVVEVKKAGFKDYRKQIKISAGSELTLRAVLEKQ